MQLRFVWLNFVAHPAATQSPHTMRYFYVKCYSSSSLFHTVLNAAASSVVFFIPNSGRKCPAGIIIFCFLAAECRGIISGLNSGEKWSLAATELQSTECHVNFIFYS